MANRAQRRRVEKDGAVVELDGAEVKKTNGKAASLAGKPVQELKAMVYDQLAIIEGVQSQVIAPAQARMRELNAEIAARMSKSA